MLDAKKIAQIDGDFGRELYTVVRDGANREAEGADDVVKEELCDGRGLDRRQCEQFNPLGEIIYHY